MTPQELQTRFGMADAVVFETGEGGLTRVVLRARHAQAHVYLHGAHITHFQRAGEAPMLFMSSRSMFETGKPMRGGVPVIFPWFGQRSEPAPAGVVSPMHGFVRLDAWSVDSVRQDRQGTLTLTLTTLATPQTLAQWPHKFVLYYRVIVGSDLRMELEVHNVDDHAWSFEESLHTYLHVGDVRVVSVSGVEETPYLDKADQGRSKPGELGPLRVTGYTDRVYGGTSCACLLDDPSLSRRIRVGKSHSEVTVIWNPWEWSQRPMPDMGEEDWRHMICIEACNVREYSVALEPGQMHMMATSLDQED